MIFQPPFRGTHVTLAWSKLGEMYPVKPCLLKKRIWLDDVFFLKDKDGSQGFSRFVSQIAKQKNEANMLGIGYVFHFPYRNTQIRYLGYGFSSPTKFGEAVGMVQTLVNPWDICYVSWSPSSKTHTHTLEIHWFSVGTSGNGDQWWDFGFPSYSSGKVFWVNATSFASKCCHDHS